MNRSLLAAITMPLVVAACTIAGGSPVARAEHPAPLGVPDSAAKTEAEMKPYTDLVEHTDAKIEMVPIRGGKFVMGSPDGEKGRKADEGPQHEVEISPFWMSKCEIPWDVYDVWASDLDILRRQTLGFPETPRDKLADVFQISQPTKPYTDMTFGMGKRGYPAICMTQHAARTFCKWLSAKTGRYYRLPTEAEWEYAARAGTKSRYWWGDKISAEYASCRDCGGEYSKLTPPSSAALKANPFGLVSMSGGVSEWVMDCWNSNYEGAATDGSARTDGNCSRRVLRGGSWRDEDKHITSSARGFYDHDVRYLYNGFRVALDVE
jgi:formylglycine-generating enzyme required for sulfatase activity